MSGGGLRPYSWIFLRRVELRMSEKTKRISALVCMLLATAGFGMSAALHRNTLIDWWIPPAVCTPFALASGLMLMRATGSALGIGSRTMNFATAFLLSLSVLLGAAYTLNFYKSRHDTARMAQATVVNKYSEQRTHTTRTHRHGTVRTEKRTAYVVVIEMPDGRRKKFDVTPGEFAKMSSRRTLSLKVEDGLLGVPVIKNMRLPISKK